MQEDSQQRIINLKHQLYSAILDKPKELWTDTELELAYILAQDRDIQKTLSKASYVLKWKKR